MLSPSQAIKNALATTRNAVGMCDKWVAQYYGYSSSGYTTAAVHWNSIPPGDKHPGDTNPPAGALVFWTGGSSGAGHVALSLGGGKIISTDYPRSGITSQTDINAITNGWGEHYAGWSTPVFQGQVSQASFPASPGGVVQAGLGSSTALSLLTGAFGTDTKDLVQRAGLILFGGILIVVGVFRIQGKKVDELMSDGKEKKNAAHKKRPEDESSDDSGIRGEEGGASVLRDGE